MRILVTGGTGVIGVATITELVRRGDAVRLLSRHASEDAARWTDVEAIDGDVSDAAVLEQAAKGCDAIIHIAGIVAEELPERTFANVNVEGTRNALAAGVRRFVFVSSLGADRGSSKYHQSKRDAEELVRASGSAWTIVRPGGVYGPGDDVISLVLRMVRALPAVPVIDGGDQPFQPIWHEDVAQALAEIVRRDDLVGKTIEIAGEETSMNDLLRRFAAITGREPLRVPVPFAAAFTATAAASLAGLPVPVDENLLLLLREHNLASSNGLSSVLGIAPTPLDDGLRALADSLPEQTSEDGVGRMRHKRYWADIAGARSDANALMELVRDRATELMPVEFDAEPHTPQRIEPGATLTGALPLRGHFQVRVEAVEPQRVVLATLQGHPLAGSVQFSAEDQSDGVRFAVDTFTRAANVLDKVAMSTVGAPLQDLNWRRFVANVVEASGGEATDGVQTSSEKLSDDDADAREKELRELVQERQRAATTSS